MSGVKIRCVVVAILLGGLLSGVSMASMYKWTDENGVVHFSNVAPTDNAEGVKEEKAYPAEHTSKPRPKTKPHTSQDIVPDFSVPGLAQKAESPLGMCQEAVNQAYDTIENYLASARKNLKGGYISQSQYDILKVNFGKIKRELSVSGCMASRGKERKFYECLADSYGDILMCHDTYEDR
ncbi:hypothetical protein DSLASN_11220 [Desulfoluna limicola]|uniref:DUF4124 domain-containing protein n=1 Tax=Desulfoluna limicola TaxID=2810562 RepID=A0ABN6F1K5_9BACT|nr:DUF4124 domain-containing protein [Desulfoluna limicola]BCS95490.1 hypothetical protein DSLASN_11220 [Desulfoluna limicola]